MSEQRTREYYDAEAWRYDRTHGAGQFGAQYGIRGYYRPFWERYLRKTDTVLEIGCGTGVFTAEFAKLVRRVGAIDLSPNMLAIAKRRNPGVGFRVASAERLPFAKGKFDAVVCVNSFTYIIDQHRALHEIRRILKPNGVLLIIEPNILCPAYWIMYFTRHRRLKLFFRRFLRSNRWSLRQLLQRNWFTVRECREENFVPHGVDRWRATLFFIPLDKMLGRMPVLRRISMRVICAAQRQEKAY